MPRFDYICRKKHKTEAERGRDCESILCPTCHKVAARLPYSTGVYLVGDTVSNGLTGATRAGNIKDRNGRWRVNLYEEASLQVADARQKEAVDARASV